MGRTRSNRVLAVLLTVLVVASGPVGLIGTAAAQSDCGAGTGDYLAISTGGTLNYAAEVIEFGGTVLCSLSDNSVEDAQSEIDLYQSAQNTAAQQEPLFASQNNYLQDTETIALLTAKNGYIKELNNDSSEAASTTAAKEANADYYSTKQYNLLQSWNATVAHAEYLENVTDNESGINDSFHAPNYTAEGGWTINYIEISQFGSTDITLGNGSKITVRSIEVTGEWENSGTTYTDSAWVDPTTGTVRLDPDDGVTDHANVTGIRVDQPTDTSYEPVQYLNFSDYSTRFSEVDSQRTSVDGEIDTLVNETFSEYQAGEINNSDLVDPYLLQQEYSPTEEFDSWALSTLSTLGVNGPENLSSVVSMEVSDQETGDQFDGILMSESNPDSGQFEANSTYDAANISGQQYVVTGSDMHELEGEFSVGAMKDNSGEHINSTTVREVDYTTANVSEMIQLYEDLREDRAEREAWQKRNAGFNFGGGLFGGGVNTTVAIAVVIGILLLGLTNRS